MFIETAVDKIVGSARSRMFYVAHCAPLERVNQLLPGAINIGLRCGQNDNAWMQRRFEVGVKSVID